MLHRCRLPGPGRDHKRHTSPRQPQATLGRLPRATARWVLPHHNKLIADAVQRVAEQHGVPMAQIALAWVLHNPVVRALIVWPANWMNSSRES
jgi:aryl-alcohol dehydrogenase-like predicted oxidoreductase